MVFLAGADWKFRALLRAELIAEGIEVEAYESVRDAVGSAANLNSLPRLLVADLFASPRPRAALRILAKWAPLIPTWLLAGQSVRPEDAQSVGAERVLFRPIDLNSLVQEIKQRIASP